MSAGDSFVLGRDCDAIEIPSGTSGVLKAGKKGVVTQTLGGTFTVQLEDGRLLRVAGADADALGQPPPLEAPAPPVAAPAPGEGITADLVWDAMKTCFDPEIPVNVVDLGLIYDCKVEGHPSGGSKVSVVMTLTAPGCGMADVLKNDIESRIRALPGVKDVRVDVSFDPPWDASRLSDAARLQLGIL
jgi:probable FeS assembly SUF system protein SufT